MFARSFLLPGFSFREDDLEHKEEDHHGYPACDKCHKNIVNGRRHVCRRDRHPQVVEPVADQGDGNPCDKIPHRLIDRISMAFECNIPLQREVNALRHKGSHFVTDKVSQTAANLTPLS